MQTLKDFKCFRWPLLGLDCEIDGTLKCWIAFYLTFPMETILLVNYKFVR